jgi:phosphoribosylformylglycinamidine synthase
MVRTGTMTTNRHSDAALVRVKGTDKALAVTTDCNSAYVYANPHQGAMIAVAEAARNIVCAGGEPVAITNCLNFGNPYNPEVYYQFAQAIKGMGDACRKFNTPVTGGNVSFYNQATFKDKVVPVYPTPTIGMLGIVDDHTKVMTLDFKSAGDVIYLVGESKNDIGSSEYLRLVHEVTQSNCPFFDLDAEYALHQVIKMMIQDNLVQSVHDISEGGAFVALLESAQAGNLGFTAVSLEGIRKDAWLFGEAQGRVIVSVKAEQSSAFEVFLKGNNTAFEKTGTVGGDSVVIDGENWGAVADWKRTYNTVLEEIMNA